MNPRSIGKFATFFVLAAMLWLSIRFFLPILLPFLLAAVLAFAAEKAVNGLQKLRLPRAAASVLGVSGTALLLAALLVLLLASLTRQIPRLMDFLPRLEEAVRSGRELLKDRLLELSGKLPGSIGTLLSGITDRAFQQGSLLVEPLLQRMPQMASDLMGKMSSGLFGTVTGLIASFMLSARLPRLRAFLTQRLPLGVQDKYAQISAGLKRALGGWLLAQCKLAAVCFFVLSLGFFLLKIRHGLLWAFLITLVDAFPILGVGTVLLPWSLVAFLQEQLPLGLGLLGIWVTVWVLRSTLEPRLVGKGLGLDPLVTLLAIYAGFKLWGIGGMLLAPIVATGAVQVWKVVSPHRPPA